MLCCSYVVLSCGCAVAEPGHSVTVLLCAGAITLAPAGESQSEWRGRRGGAQPGHRRGGIPPLQSEMSPLSLISGICPVSLKRKWLVRVVPDLMSVLSGLAD